MKTKAFTAITLTVFLSSMLCTVFIVPTIAENQVISNVERLKDVCWFHLMTGLYPNGVTVRDIYYEEKGYLALTYRNLSPDFQVIRLTTTPSANHAFWHWPEKTAWEVGLVEDPPGSTWIIWGVVLDELYLMEDLWFLGWDLGHEVEVTLELLEPYYDVLYQDTLTIMPPGH